MSVKVDFSKVKRPRITRADLDAVCDWTNQIYRTDFRRASIEPEVLATIDLLVERARRNHGS